jgi:hypothetical protein
MSRTVGTVAGGATTFRVEVEAQPHIRYRTVYEDEGYRTVDSWWAGIRLLGSREMEVHWTRGGMTPIAESRGDALERLSSFEVQSCPGREPDVTIFRVDGLHERWSALYVGQESAFVWNLHSTHSRCEPAAGDAPSLPSLLELVGRDAERELAEEQCEDADEWWCTYQTRRLEASQAEMERLGVAGSFESAPGELERRREDLRRDLAERRRARETPPLVGQGAGDSEGGTQALSGMQLPVKQP